MHVETLIALAVQHALRKSMRGLAEQMGIKVASLSDWKTGKSPIPDERIHQLAKIAGLDPKPWLMIIKAEQEGGELGREYMKIFKQIGGLVAVLALVAIGWKVGGLPDLFSLKTQWLATVPMAGFTLAHNVHYAKFALLLVMAFILHGFAANRRSDP